MRRSPPTSPSKTPRSLPIPRTPGCHAIYLSRPKVVADLIRSAAANLAAPAPAPTLGSDEPATTAGPYRQSVTTVTAPERSVSKHKLNGPSRTWTSRLVDGTDDHAWLYAPAGTVVH